MKIKHVVIFVILLTAGNFLRLYIEDKNIPDIEISEEASYKKDKAKKENDLSKTDKKFDVNSVSYDELLKLGFQKSKAEKIIEFRDEMGIISDIKIEGLVLKEIDEYLNFFRVSNINYSEIEVLSLKNYQVDVSVKWEL